MRNLLCKRNKNFLHILFKTSGRPKRFSHYHFFPVKIKPYRNNGNSSSHGHEIESGFQSIHISASALGCQSKKHIVCIAYSFCVAVNKIHIFVTNYRCTTQSSEYKPKR